MTRVLVIGRTGQLARELARAPLPAGWSLEFAGRERVDLADFAQVAAVVAEVAPDAVINAAAYTAVDRAESEPALAFAVNGAGVGALARACERVGAPLVHVSTDYAFDGLKDAPYLESDRIGPQSTYGASKADGEARVRAAGPHHLIVRTSWVFSPFGSNFVKTMLRLGAERVEIRVVADQHGAPTSAADLARALIAMLEAVRAGRGKFGTYHCANAGETTWHGFAESIFDEARARGMPAPKRLIPITTAEYPTPAHRPANSRLDCGALARAFSLRMRPWREALGDCLDDLQAGVGGA